ncbi:hypothetical protein RHMOL_Rhmol04G0319500 [Rhododendron molle]|uniref:Uncharacterized protein n=2 Tax=Rhododendron molle TaxID=49168 RepID=A0ACC0P696_RHOML|nr:hypothetical protein RHMOL_Rhmol04G0319500 [Rhododendron molle]KAI8561198.1 hypothetical protein RHMOL_Rhmol04G0319500 [Rhododendron molle]
MESRSRQPRSVGRGSGSGSGSTTSSAPSQNQQPTVDGHQALQSLASLANQRNINSLSPGQLPPALGQIMESLQMGGQGAESADGNFDAASVMSQVLHTPALNGLLAGVSEQTGIGSPDALKNMLQQFTQNPAMRNTVNQLAQQFDSQDLGSMFSGLGRGQGGGIDLASMVQQMMPIVSQALGGGPTTSRPTSVFGPDPQSQCVERSSDRDEKPTDQESQIDLEEVVQRIEHPNPPGEIFRSMAESAANLFDNDSGDDLVNELCCDEGLASMDSTARSHSVQKIPSLLGLGFGVFKAKNLEIKMASVGVVDDDRSGGSFSRRLGLQKWKVQEKRAFYPKESGWGRRRTRSSKGKEKRIKDDAYYRPGIIKENLDTWKAEYHFVKVDKLAYKMFRHYITFEALVERKDAAPVYSQFQAIVFARPGEPKDDMEVILCRLKPNA